MDNGVAPITSPVLHFRLDPGEPGVLQSSPAGTSTVRVFGQETRNLTRLKAEAAREGKSVIYADVSLGLRKVGNRVVAASGHTRVITRPRPEASGVATTAGRIGVSGQSPVGLAEAVPVPPQATESEPKETGRARSDSSGDPAEVREAQQETLQLKMQAEKLLDRVEDIRREGEDAESEVEETRLGRSETYIDERLKQINDEIRKVEFRLTARKALGDGPESLRILPAGRRITYFIRAMPLTAVLLEESA